MLENLSTIHMMVWFMVINTTFNNISIVQWQLEEFEDTNGAIRNRISKKNRQHTGQKKKHKRTNNDRQNIHIKLKFE